MLKMFDAPPVIVFVIPDLFRNPCEELSFRACCVFSVLQAWNPCEEPSFRACCVFSVSQAWNPCEEPSFRACCVFSVLQAWNPCKHVCRDPSVVSLPLDNKSPCEPSSLREFVTQIRGNPEEPSFRACCVFSVLQAWNLCKHVCRDPSVVSLPLDDKSPLEVTS